MKKTTRKTQRPSPIPFKTQKGIDRWRWAAPIFLVLVLLVFYSDPTLRLVRLCWRGDAIERIKLDFSTEGVRASWGYACWLMPFSEPAKCLGFDYMKLSDCKVRPVRSDRNIDGGVLAINGQTFTQGVGGHAPSKVAFDLDGKYSKFSCKVGLDASSDPANTGVVFVIFADGKEVSRSPKLGNDANAYPMSCDLTGVKELVLYADNLRFDNLTANVDWVDLQFAAVLPPSTLPKTN